MDKLLEQLNKMKEKGTTLSTLKKFIENFKHYNYYENVNKFELYIEDKVVIIEYNRVKKISNYEDGIGINYSVQDIPKTIIPNNL